MAERTTNISETELRQTELFQPNAPYSAAKFMLDKLFALALLPGVIVAGVFLFCINPIWNPGPLIYRQKRMGKNCKPFMMVKFRSMLPAAAIARGPEEGVEADRITPLGRFLRRTRIDELPQIFNILLGEMSLIGPRPDYWEHAVHYAEHVPGYKERHTVRPGITGLAQVTSGYVEGSAATRIKTQHDLTYIRRLGLRMESHIVLRTFVVIFTGFGAR